MFTLKGKSNAGKTTLIKKIAQWIIDNYPVVNNTLPSPLPGKKSNGVDEEDIIGKLQIGNLVIGFNSAGDNLDECEKIEKLISENEEEGNVGLNIIINACRTKGSTREYIDTFVKNNKIIHKYIDIDTNNRVRIEDELKSWLIGLEKL